MLTIETATAPSWADADHTAISLTVKFESFGEPVPFCAHPDDIEAHGRELYQRAMLGEFGSIAEYVAPPPPEPQIPSRVTMRQARLALHAAGKLGLVEAAINAMNEPSRTAARIEWDYSNEVRRDNVFIADLAAAIGMTSEEVDTLFIEAAIL